MFSALRGMLLQEMEELAHTVAVCEKRMALRTDFAARLEEDILADSLAACLHSFYSGIEGLFETISLELEEGLPKGDRWHKKLLNQMTAEIPDVRSPVVSRHTADLLEPFRAFRHLFRNLYTHRLLPERIFQLAETLPKTWEACQKDLHQFLLFLGRLDAS